MSIRQGNRIIASTGANGLQMFDFKWSDHTINDLNWILSSPNSWHSGSTYKKMYQHLVNDWETGTTGISETIAGYTIYYCLSPDGHKLVDYNQESTVQQIYDATGVAWYYILDGNNKQFKLPRTKYAFNSGDVEDLGKYIEPGLPNITGSVGMVMSQYSPTGAFYVSTTSSNVSGVTKGYTGEYDDSFDASRSSTIYGNSDTVQPPATKCYYTSIQQNLR